MNALESHAQDSHLDTQLKAALVRQLTHWLEHLTQPPSEKYTTIADIAARFHLSRWTIERALKRGLLEGIKVSGRWRILPSAVEKWLGSQTADVTNTP